MSTAPTSSELDAALSRLFAERADPNTSHERRIAIDAAIAALVLLGARYQPTATNSYQPQQQPLVPAPAPEPGDPKRNPFFGMGLREAASKHLSTVGKPQVPREIWDALKAAGFQSAHSDPVHAVNDALRRREKTHGDVLLVGRGQWGKKEWYTEEQLEEIAKSMGGMGGRDRGSHIERTKRGMAVAKARGARIGAVSKLSDEQWADVERMLREGAPQEGVVAKYGIVRQTLYNKFGLEKIREFRALAKQERLKAGPRKRERLDEAPLKRERLDEDDEDAAGETRH